VSTHFDALESQLKLLPLKQKAELARLIEELETSVDADLERLWIEEARRRYDAYLRGELESSPGEEVMSRARDLLK
jgi:predicted methyltransferase MtxX (methanogen marker protein 4)